MLRVSLVHYALVSTIVLFPRGPLVHTNPFFSEICLDHRPTWPPPPLSTVFINTTPSSYGGTQGGEQGGASDGICTSGVRIQLDEVWCGSVSSSATIAAICGWIWVLTSNVRWVSTGSTLAHRRLPQQ